MTDNAFQVRFEGLQHAGGLFNSYAFLVVPPDTTQSHTLLVNVSTSLQTQLWHDYDTEHQGIMAMAACAVSLHLGEQVPGDVYRDQGTTLFLSTNWYPGHPDEPNQLSNFEAFEVPDPDNPLGLPQD
jgi:hypothetical protein